MRERELCVGKVEGAEKTETRGRVSGEPSAIATRPLGVFIMGKRLGESQMDGDASRNMCDAEKVTD